MLYTQVVDDLNGECISRDVLKLPLNEEGNFVDFGFFFLAPRWGDWEFNY